MTSDARGLIGLAQRAGMCLSGAELCERAAREGTARLLLLDDSASTNTKDRFRAIAAAAGIGMLEVSALGQAIGKEGRRVCAILDRGFADAIEQKYGIL